MPTLDMFEEGVNDWERQLSLRFAMDSVSKQRRWYNDEFFQGTAVVDQGAKTFEAKVLAKRKVIKPVAQFKNTSSYSQFSGAGVSEARP